MPTSKFTPGDEKQDEKLNPGQQDYERRLGDLSKAEGRGTFDDKSADDKKGSDSQAKDDAQKVQDEEHEGSGSWRNNTTEQSNPNLNQPKVQKVLGFARKRGGILGLIALFGVTGGIIATFLGPSSMLINLVENITVSNDSSSTAMERRFMAVFDKMTANDPVCASPSSRTIKCKGGRISNSALRQLEKKGVTAVFADGTTNTDKRTGYPSRNPTSYEVDFDGKKTTIPAGEFRSFMVDNPKIAARVLGVSGAFNMRMQAWAGGYISKAFFRKFGLERKGGLADGTHQGGTTKERLDAAYEKLREKIPGMTELASAESFKERLNKKVSEHMGKAKKGGVGYVTAVAACMGVKAPSIIAAGVAAVQLAQLLPIYNEVIASPGAKLKASGYGLPTDITAEDMDVLGSMLTEKTKDAETGESGSALDSPLLQSAMGVNTNPVTVSSAYTPGLSILLATKDWRNLQKASEPGCNVIMSPAAMWTAFAVDSAITAATSATIIGGIIKVGASIIITEVASAAIQELISQIGIGFITDLAENDKIPQARGEALGDVLGIGGTAFYSAGGMARGLPTLKESQLSEVAAVQQENEAFQREMDLATLSPFDTSSKYTFLGSIAYNTRMAVLQSGVYGNAFGTLSTVATLPFSSVIPSTNAATNYTETACGYAEQFGLEADAETPAIGLSGLPCVGLNRSQTNMGVDEAINLLIDEGWLDNSKPVKDNSSITTLVADGIIKPDTPLADFIATCTDASLGDYAFNAASCSAGTATQSTEAYGGGMGEDGGVTYDESGYGNAGTGVQNARSLEAMSVFLIDFQISQSVNGEDIDTGEEETPATGGTGAVSLPVNPGYILTDGWEPRSCSGCASFHTAQDFAGGDHVVKSATDGVVVQADKSGTSNNIVRIQAPNGVYTEYWHMYSDDILVNTGDTVTAGQQIGTMGCLGICFGTHLHFMVDVTDATDPQVKAITTRPRGGDFGTRTYASPGEWFALYGITM